MTEKMEERLEDKTGRLLALTAYMEAHMDQGLDTACLTGAEDSSRRQLYRDFYSLAGCSVKAYMEKRRLSNALAAVKTAAMSMADIACQWGYSSQQAFCRAVRRAVHMSPTQYKTSEAYYYFPPFRGERLFPAAVAPETIPETLVLRYANTAPEGIEERALRQFRAAAPGWQGRVFGARSREEDGGFVYELRVTGEVPPAALARAGFTGLRTLPARDGIFASVTVPNREETVQAAWDCLYKDWLTNSLFVREPQEPPHFEEYLWSGDGMPAGRRLYLPVEREKSLIRLAVSEMPARRFVTARAGDEATAWNRAGSFLAACCPHAVKAMESLYFHRDGLGEEAERAAGDFVCGIPVSAEADIPIRWQRYGVENRTAEAGWYLVLYGYSACDCEAYGRMLLEFARHNGLAVEEGSLFALYPVKGKPWGSVEEVEVYGRLMQPAAGCTGVRQAPL